VGPCRNTALAYVRVLQGTDPGTDVLLSLVCVFCFVWLHPCPLRCPMDSQVATFYTMFNKQRVGKYFIQLCGTTPCMVCGAEEIKSTIEKTLGIHDGGTYQQEGGSDDSCVVHTVDVGMAVNSREARLASVVVQPL
jgi:hypothetical protein